MGKKEGSEGYWREVTGFGTLKLFIRTNMKNNNFLRVRKKKCSSVTRSGIEGSGSGSPVSRNYI